MALLILTKSFERKTCGATLGEWTECGHFLVFLKVAILFSIFRCVATLCGYFCGYHVHGLTLTLSFLS